MKSSNLILNLFYTIAVFDQIKQFVPQKIFSILAKIV